MRTKSVVALVGLICLIGGCTYSGNIDKSFYQPSSRDDLQGGKIPLSAAVVLDEGLRKVNFRATANGYSVDIPLGEPLAQAIEQELGTIFRRSGIVGAPKAGEYDLYVYPKVGWIETYRNQLNGDLQYLVKLKATVKDIDRQFTVFVFETKKRANYSPPAEAKGAQILTGASLYILAPLTVPLTTQAVGSEAKDVIGATIIDLVKEFGEALVEDGSVRDYAALRHTDAAPGASAAAPAAPSPRAKSMHDDLLDGVVTIRTADSQALAAVHEFLRFQIRDHRTGDPLE